MIFNPIHPSRPKSELQEWMNIVFFLVVFSETVKSDIARTSTFFKGEIIIFFSETETCMRFDFFQQVCFIWVYHMALFPWWIFTGGKKAINLGRGTSTDPTGHAGEDLEHGWLGNVGNSTKKTLGKIFIEKMFWIFYNLWIIFGRFSSSKKVSRLCCYFCQGTITSNGVPGMLCFFVAWGSRSISP